MKDPLPSVVLQPNQSANIAQNHATNPRPVPLQSRKRKLDDQVPFSQKVSKRYRLTERNLREFEAAGGRRIKSVVEYWNGDRNLCPPSAITSAADEEFGSQLGRNGIIDNENEQRVPTDLAKVKRLLKKARRSEPPDEMSYQRYVKVSGGTKNNLTIQASVYPLLAKTIPVDRSLAGYRQSCNYEWVNIDNDLADGLGDATPDIFESFGQSEYPALAIDQLSCELTPSNYPVAMPAFAVELLDSDEDILDAGKRCAYVGALMTNGAYAINRYLNEDEKKFFGKTQAITVAFNGVDLQIFSHHAVSNPQTSAQPGNKRKEISDGVEEDQSNLKYHRHLIDDFHPRDSYEDFLMTYKYVRNAQDLGYRFAVDRINAIWKHENRISGNEVDGHL